MIYLVVLSAFLIRALPRLLHPNALVADSYFHMYCAEVIAQNSCRIPDRLPRVMLKHAYTYPFLYHLLLALFPPGFRPWAERLTGAAFDTVNVALVYLFSSWAVKLGGLLEGERLPILVTTLYAFSPALLRLGSGPRAYNGSPRVMGQTLYLIHLLCSFYAYSTRNRLALFVALIAGAAVIVTSKFGNQALLFFGIFFGLFVSYHYCWVLGGSLLVALLFSGGHAWKVIGGQVRHSIFYFSHLQRPFLSPHLPTLKRYIRSAAAQIWGLLRKGDLKGALEWWYSEPHPLHLLLTVYPQFLLLPTLLLQSGKMGHWEKFLSIWAAAGLFWFLLTKFRPFLFLGEGERYLEYALFPSLWLMVGLCLPERKLVVWSLLGYSLISAIYYLWSYHRRHQESEEEFDRAERAFRDLNKMPSGVIMPIGAFQWHTLYWSRFPVLTTGANIDGTILSPEEFLLVYGNYPYPSEQFARIVKEYHVSYIVSDRAHLDHYLSKILKTPQDFYGKVRALYQSPKLIIFQTLKA
jgi:hypothetical protein